MLIKLKTNVFLAVSHGIFNNGVDHLLERFETIFTTNSRCEIINEKVKNIFNMKFNPLLSSDGYKVGHHLMYAPGTTMVYSNYTCRNVHYMPLKAKDIVVFGVQYTFKYIQEFLEW